LKYFLNDYLGGVKAFGKGRGETKLEFYGTKQSGSEDDHCQLSTAGIGISETIPPHQHGAMLSA